MYIKLIIVQIETYTTKPEHAEPHTFIIHTYMNKEGEDTPDITEAQEYNTLQEAIDQCCKYQNQMDDPSIRYFPKPILAD